VSCTHYASFITTVAYTYPLERPLDTLTLART